MRPVRRRSRAVALSSTAAPSCGDASSVAARTLSPGPAATPTFSSPGPEFRNANPSANARTIGNPKTQKIASGSR